MTSIVASVLTAYAYPRSDEDRARERGNVEKSVQFAPGLSEEERDFVTQNKALLGSGRAKRAADLTRSTWQMFRSIPIVFQLLTVVVLFVCIITTPFLIMYIIRAIEAPDSQIRMIATLCSFVAVFVAIVLVLLLM